jgi:hypothetical protein
MHKETFMVKFYGPTTFKGSRFKVTSRIHGSGWIDYDHAARDAAKQAVLDFAARKGLKIEIIEEVYLGGLYSSLNGCYLFILKVQETNNET